MLQKLADLINSGADIEFSVNGRMYTILPWTDGGITIGPQNSDDDMVFKDVDALVSGFLIDGKPLANIIDQVVIVFSG